MSNENEMTPSEKQTEGRIEQMKGKVQRKVGEMMNDSDLETRGRATEARGEDKEESARTEGKVKGTAKELTGSAVEKVGEMTSDETTRKKGKALRLDGEAQQSAVE